MADEADERATGNVNGQVPSPNGPAAGLRSRLDDPQTAALLHDILDRLEVVDVAIRGADELLRRADQISLNVAETVVDFRKGIDPEMVRALASLATRTPKLVRALEQIEPALDSPALRRLAAPEVLDSLAALTERIGLLEFAAHAATEFLERADTIVENVADGVRDVRRAAEESTFDLIALLTQVGALLPGLQSLLGALTPLVQSGAIDALAKSKVLAPEVVRSVGQLGDALHATQVKEVEAPTSVGIFGLLKTLRDPDAQRAMGFLSTFLKEFGSRLH